MEAGRILARWDGARPPEPCSVTYLDSGGALYLGLDHTLTALSHGAVYLANCPDGFLTRRDYDGIPYASDNIHVGDPVSGSEGSGPGFSDLRDPFYASTFPVFYALAATTVTAYMLVIMLFITPRTFINGGIVYLGRRNRFTNRSSNTVDVGGRPWLQKVAALTVAISLTVATVATFRVAAKQYSWGIQNALLLQSEVMDSTPLKIIRLISDTFLWLAQAQTLIRLFQRQREKIIIKWVAFALITLDVIFSALNSFQYTNSGSQGNMRPRTFVEAVPALSYLFQLSLGLLYGAWVIYYSILKKRYAFYHPLMKNMPLVAVISLFSILVPSVFFILDISKPELTGWGDYVRWVGAAAASVVVWEWVERIEALEREEKKDGILGRQVIDGDDMIEVTASSDSSWSRFRKEDSEGDRGVGGGHGNGDGSIYGGPFSSGRGSTRGSLANRYRVAGSQGGRESVEEMGGERLNLEPLRPPVWPRQTSTPASRTDTTSGDSTVYMVRYHNQSESTGRTPDPVATRDMVPLSRDNSLELAPSGPAAEDGDAHTRHHPPTAAAGRASSRSQYSRRSIDMEANGYASREDQGEGRWPRLANMVPLFRREPQRPPAAVLPHHRPEGSTTRERGEGLSPRQRDDLGKWDIRGRLEEFAVTRAEKLRERMRPPADTESLRVTVIPAPQRNGAALEQLLEEEGGEEWRSSGGSDGAGRASGESSPPDPDYVAPPMWPGVQPAYYAESSRSSSFESEEGREREESPGRTGRSVGR
ncbi:related to pH signal transduction protein PalH [Cephalotrichum gorgonifer]|uniref:Related to pH signal transduction protein PalH n=1 Tax=Cephalotrichum gorgonifer TaxID=2041049 RepID=A0AAE8SVN6_9PEZI|nr:related to pH signal transduction protein PalH [Cephalotrichum gorgonifer]